MIEWPNLRGTFHNHTNASDGRNTLEEMAAAARELGLEYLGIADHREIHSAYGSDENLLSQVQRIRELNKQGSTQFHLFAGVECDILRDGRLDFPDEILSQLDYVVASVHASFTQPEKEMTRRIIRAIENPYVTMLGHPTGRLLLEREPYQVDLVEVIRAAARTGTVIDETPARAGWIWIGGSGSWRRSRG